VTAPSIIILHHRFILVKNPVKTAEPKIAIKKHPSASFRADARFRKSEVEPPTFNAVVMLMKSTWKETKHPPDINADKQKTDAPNEASVDS